MKPRTQRRPLKFVQVPHEVLSRADLTAPAMLVLGALMFLTDPPDAPELAERMGWPLRNVQRALAQLLETNDAELAPQPDRRERRYRPKCAPEAAGNSAPHVAQTSAPEAARISDECAPDPARMSAPLMTSVRAASGAHLDPHTSFSDLDLDQGEKPPHASSEIQSAPDPARIYPGQVAKREWIKAIEANGGVSMDSTGADAHRELVAIEDAAERVVVKLAQPATLVPAERRRRRDELIGTWAMGWVSGRYATAKQAGKGIPRLRVTWWAESVAEAAAAGGRMPGVAKSRGMSIGREPIAAHDARKRIANLTSGAAEALEGLDE